MKKKIEITVHYDSITIKSDSDLEEGLKKAIVKAIEGDLLRPSGEEIVDDWKVDIT